MKPELAQFGTDNKNVKLVKVNIDERDGKDWKKYKKQLTSRSIPYTVVLDRTGKRLTTFTGFKDAAGIEAVIESTR